jgi:hypothetical protein
VKALSELFSEEYSDLSGLWKAALKAELKMDEIDPKCFKTHLDLGGWPTLSLARPGTAALAGSSAWKKCSQTYMQLDERHLARQLQEDLAAGVRVFFFHQQFLNSSCNQIIHGTLSNTSDAADVEIFILGKTAHLLEAGLIHAQGGHNVQELGFLCCQLIEDEASSISHLGVYLDSHFFKNIAKVRALKLLAARINELKKTDKQFKIVTLNSYREWTLFERYSNILRNNVQVACGLIAGADIIQSSGYQLVFDLETDVQDSEHNERSLRMARNTHHILSLESMLGVVQDASAGSYHLESLSMRYAEEAWKFMQQLLPMSQKERQKFLDNELKKLRDTRAERVNCRKDILAGMNDFPNGSEQFDCQLNSVSNYYRVSRPFELLRLKVGKLKNRPLVQVLIQGNYAALNTRLNFIKNYFEVIGLEVKEKFQGDAISTEDILVLCATDEAYPEIAAALTSPALARYVAGKVAVDGFENISAGQNVLAVLTKLVEKLEVSCE